MEVAFTAKFPEGFKDGKTLVLEATPKDHDSWFCVSLATSNNILETKHDEPRWAVPFQIQFRYDTKLVVLNAHTGHSWGPEERHPLNFDTSDKLKLKLKATHDDIEIYVNDNHFANFKHRHDLQSISHFNVYGDFVVKKVKV